MTLGCAGSNPASPAKKKGIFMSALYEKFNNWLYTDGVHKNAIYILSDPHFNDPDEAEFRDEYPGDEELVKRINLKVQKNDTVIFLGDIGDTYLLNKIRGYKVLITGNHDKGINYYKPWFNEVYDGPLMINDRLLLSHEPLTLPDCMFNIHGHAHKCPTSDNFHLNVCVEFIEYSPLCLTSLLKNGLLIDVMPIHRDTINKAVKRLAASMEEEWAANRKRNEEQ